MDNVELLQLRQTVTRACQMSFFHWAGEILQVHSKLTEPDRDKLVRDGTELVKYVQISRDPDKPPRMVGSRLRIPWLREHSIDSLLAELACLWPLIQCRRGKRQLHIPAHLSDDMLETAAEWLSEAVECLECFHLLPAALQREWLGGKSPAPDNTLNLLAALIARSITSPEDDLAIYRGLSKAEGQRLATLAIQLLNSGTISGQAIAEDILERLACLVPASLQGCHSRLAEHGNFRCGGGVIYRDANSRTSALLLQMEDSVEDYDGWLKALAWIGDVNVQKQFGHWRNSRSRKWKDRIHVKPHQYSYEAGWELTQEGKRRQLYFDTCYQLILAEEAPQDAIPGPVEVASQRKDQCGQCGHPLTNLFDIDLKNPRMKFLGIRGSRLRIATCTSCWACVYCSYDTKGNSTWISSDEATFESDEFYPLKSHALVLGRPGRTPVESLLAGSQRNAGSWIGGHPDWLNDALFPRCPKCKASMVFLGQVDLISIDGNGNAYAFLCRDCCIAATTYDCT